MTFQKKYVIIDNRSPSDVQQIYLGFVEEVMFFGKPEEIVVEPNSEYLIWEIPVQGIKAKKVVLRVESGCEAIFYVDGHPYSYGPNKYDDLAWRRELKAGSKVSLVGVNRSKVFKSTFGVGHIPFHDASPSRAVSQTV